MIRSFFAPLSIFVLVGCSTGEVKLGVDVTPTGSAASSITAATGANGATTGTGRTRSQIVLERVRLLVNNAKVHGGSQHDGVESGPFVIDLSASEIEKGAHRDFALGALAAGTYEDAEIEIEPLRIDDQTSAGATAAELADFSASGASVLVDGTFKGTTFHFAGHFKAEQGKEASFAVAAGTALSIPMVVSPASWFVDPSGNDRDPTDAAQHAAIAVAICHKLDTEADSAAAATGKAPAGGHDGHDGHGGQGPRAHCVE